MIRCPQCQGEWIEILAVIMTAVGPDGIDYTDIDDRNVTPHWDDESFCRCKDCDYERLVSHFLCCDTRLKADVTVLIPYSEIDGGAAEVWIGRCPPGADLVALAHQALKIFAALDAIDSDDKIRIQEHCHLWGADRILLPTDETPPRWTAYAIAEILEGRLVEAE